MINFISIIIILCLILMSFELNILKCPSEFGFKVFKAIITYIIIVWTLFHM